MNAYRTHPEEPFIKLKVRSGSIAHSTGTHHRDHRPVDNRPLDNLPIESDNNQEKYAKIEKTERGDANPPKEKLIIHAGLGITIAGSEEHKKPVILSKLGKAGIYTGDELAAIRCRNRLKGEDDNVQSNTARPSTAPVESNCDLLYSSFNSIDDLVNYWDIDFVKNTNFPINHDAVKDFGSNPLYLNPEKNQFLDHTKGNSQLQFSSNSKERCSPHLLTDSQVCTTINTIKYDPSSSGQSQTNILVNEVYHITLRKDTVYDDYGFSVSDGLYKKGVYVNRIRKGGPADIEGFLKPYDRIVQINKDKTQELDCNMAASIISAAGDSIDLVVVRHSFAVYSDEEDPMQDVLSRKCSPMS